MDMAVEMPEIWPVVERMPQNLGGFSHDDRRQYSAIEKECYGNMSRKTLVTLLLIIISALLAVALFIAGAIWRGRVTAQSALTDSRKLPLTAKLAASSRRQSEEASRDVQVAQLTVERGRPCYFDDCARITAYTELIRFEKYVFS
jgi:hypothetical protein